MKTKYKIEIEFESNEVSEEDLDMECQSLLNKFSENGEVLDKLRVKWLKVKEKMSERRECEDCGGVFTVEDLDLVKIDNVDESMWLCRECEANLKEACR